MPSLIRMIRCVPSSVRDANTGRRSIRACCCLCRSREKQEQSDQHPGCKTEGGNDQVFLLLPVFPSGYVRKEKTAREQAQRNQAQA